MSAARIVPELTLHGEKNDPRVKEAIELLDKCGLAYRHVEASTGGATHEKRTSHRAEPQLTAGRASLTRFSRAELLDFLWACGARFEDS